ncbi:MAG: ATP-binding protein [Saprospiraceae bacterium]
MFTLRTKYILFIILIHLVALVLTFFIFKAQPLLFIASEAIILLSLYFAYRLYRGLVQPLKLIMTGIDAIRDRDFNVKFQAIGQIELDKLIQVYNEMIEQLRDERRLQAEQHFFLDKLIQTAPSGILILHFDGQIASCNPTAVKLLKTERKELINKSLSELPGPLAAELANLQADMPHTININGIETYKCQKSHFIDRGFPHYFITIEELTDEKLQIEKEAYGKVIRMMAHEVNNSIGPINSILDSLHFYQSQLQPDHQEEYTNALEVAVARNQKLNRFMRNFADVVRLPSPHLESANLQQLLRDIHTLMQAYTGTKKITFQLQLPDSPITHPLDIQQMEQVLINVVKNAIEAITDEGEIQIRLQPKPLCIQILDNGVGLSQEQNTKLFSPFYSTKTTGQGIGLTLTREILRNHGFTFSLHTQPNGWTLFEIGLAAR